MPRVAVAGRVPVANRVAVAGRSPVLTRQNKFTDSQNPAGANWTVLNTTRVANFGPNPLGTANDSMQMLEAVSGAAEHSIYNSGALQVFQQTGWFTVSCWFKAGSRNFAGFFQDFATAQIQAAWNLTTGANTLLSIAGSGIGFSYGSNLIAHAEASTIVPGWWRLGVSWEAIMASPPAVFIRCSMSATGATMIYAGVAGESVELWGPQLVKANWPGPQQQTNPAAVNASSALRNLNNQAFP